MTPQDTRDTLIGLACVGLIIAYVWVVIKLS